MDTTTSPPAGDGAPRRWGAPGNSAGARLHWPALTWGAAAVYFASTYDRGWIPHDEGTLGQTAWRILLGEVPHRDFDALYTGLLGYLNAAAMTVMGVHLLAPRVVLLLAFLAWVAVVWSILSRFAAPPLASAATLLCVTIGPAIYPAAMPSWYNLFLATGGLWSLIRWTEDGRSRWLVAAGAFAGVSVLFKITGLYFLAATLFSVLHVELADERAGATPRDELRKATVGPAVLATLLLATLVAMVALLVRSQPGVSTLVHYILPTFALAMLAAWHAWRAPLAPWGALGRAGRGWGLVLAAFTLPVAAFVAAFAGMDAVGALLHGVFVLPTRRLVTAAGGHLPLHLTAGVLVPIGLLTLERRLGPAGRRRLAVATGVAGVTVLVWAAIPGVYRAAWFSLQVVVPVAVVAGALIAYRSASHMGVTGRVRLLTPVLWTAALTSLLQFPLAGPIYFAHIAPMGVLAAVAAMGALRREAPTGPVGQGSTGGARAVAGSTAEAWATVGYPVLLTVTAFYVAFLVAGPNRAGYFGPPSGSELVRLPLERGHLRVSSATAQEYGRLTTALRELSRSETIYVTPDAPEVYFLSGLRNPTRTLFEIFDEPGVTRSILDALELHEVNVVVLNTGADFSTPPPGVVTELERRYPRAARIGRFVVRWR